METVSQEEHNRITTNYSNALRAERELNAELLAALKEVWASASHHLGPRIQDLVESVVTKAESK